MLFRASKNEAGVLIMQCSLPTVLRYLLAVPPSPDDKKHNVRLAYGNGCRPDVWEKFRERFGVTHISEFFASSEGAIALFSYSCFWP